MSKNTFNIDTVGTGIKLVDFGQAIKAMKDGKRVQRSGWNGKGLFVFMQVPSDVPAEIIPKMSSLPQSVKDEFERRYVNSNNSYLDPILFNKISYRNQFVIVYPDNTLYGWVASPSDIATNDWIVLD